MQMGFLSVLTVVFITLKLTGIISWSWFYVLLPTLSIFIVLGGFLLVASILVLRERK